MLLALLYGNDDQILAAAPACDQADYGDAFWSDCHAAEISQNDVFETAYVSIEQPDLVERLLSLGIDSLINGAALTREVESFVGHELRLGKAA